MVMAGLVGRFGVAALAGYGIGVRLEFMVAPIAFGIGTGLTTLVGVAAGAGAWRRAVRATWTGGLVSFGVIGLIGWTVALMPESWARLFTSDAAVVAASAAYITRVAPFDCLFGLALTLYFASQGAGRMACARRGRCRAHDRDGPRRLACRRDVRSGIGRACSPRLPSAWPSMAA